MIFLSYFSKIQFLVDNCVVLLVILNKYYILLFIYKNKHHGHAYILTLRMQKKNSQIVIIGDPHKGSLGDVQNKMLITQICSFSQR